MKVLVVDDDPNAQRILKLLLQRTGSEPLVCPDESSGLQVVTGEDPPHVIICDWKAQGTNAPSFCKKVRAAKLKVRPYIFVLTTKQSKEELAEALDAGADDFVCKPFNLVEMQARLRVATRHIEHQRDLLREVDEAAAIAQRNQLLGELLSKQQSAKIPTIMQSAAAAVTSVKQAQGAKLGEFSQYELRFLVSAALLELKLVLESTKQRLVPPSIKTSELCVWAPLLLKREQLWIDLMFSCSVQDGAHLFEKSLQRKPEGFSETFAFMAEIARILSAAFMRTLQLKDPETCLPMMAKAIQPSLSGAMPPLNADHKSHELVIEGRTFYLTIAITASPRLEVDLASLRELDVLAEQIPPSSISEIPMFKQGTIMNSRFVQKLREEAELTRFDYMALVHRPSLFARFFNHL